MNNYLEEINFSKKTFNMKELLIGIFSIIIVGFLAHQIADWWIIVIVAGIVGVLLQIKPSKSFLFGFLGVALLWGIVAFRLDAQNGGILSARMGQVFGDLSGFSMILVTALLGGLLGGLGAMTGSLLRKINE